MAKIETIRHSLAHILALTIKEIYPDVKLGIGPAIENGFYYDFDFKENISEEDLLKIEKKMKRIIRENLSFKKEKISKKKAKEIFKKEPYKLELISQKSKVKSQKLFVYQSGDFVDLCAGPHIKSTKEINSKGFKLTKIAGAYWKGNEKNPMLTRIYGVASDLAGTTFMPLPYASPVLADNIELWVDNANVNIKVGKDRSSYTVSYIVVEYIST